MEDTFKATLDTHIPETNIGFKLLLKMGWTQGRGLGRNGNGAPQQPTPQQPCLLHHSS